MFTTMMLHKLITLLTAIVSFNILIFLILPYLLFVCNLVNVDYTPTTASSCHALLNGTRRESNFLTSTFETLDVYDTKPPVPRYYQLPLLYGSFEQVMPKISPPNGSKMKIKKKKKKKLNSRIINSMKTQEVVDSSWYNLQTNSPFFVLQHVYEKHIPLIYICVIIVSEIGVTIYFFRQLLSLIKGVVYDQTADTWFKNLFASWNYSVVCPTSKILKHQSIYQHIKQKIRFSKYDSKKSCIAYCCFVAARMFGAVLTLIFLGIIIFSIHFVSMFTPKETVQNLMENGYIKDEGAVSSKVKTDWQIFFAFLPPLLVTMVKYITPPMARIIGRMENYRFTFKVSFYSARLFLNRAAALFTLVTTVYHVRIMKENISNSMTTTSTITTTIHNTASKTPSSPTANNMGNQLNNQQQNVAMHATSLVNHRKHNEDLCWEDQLCLQLIFLVIFDFLGDVVLILFIRFPRVVFQGIFKQSWNCSVKLNYDPYETMIDLIWDLGLMMLGMLYCPILPIFICAKLLIIYGLKVFHIWVNCSASRDIHSASYIRFLFMGFSSIIILFSTIASIFAATSVHVSPNCGPFKMNQEKIIDIFARELQEIPAFINSNLSTMSLAYILVGSIFVLLFGLYISHLKRLSIEKTANELKCQLAITTQEKCYLISKIKRFPSSRSGASSSIGGGGGRNLRSSSRQNSVLHD